MEKLIEYVKNKTKNSIVTEYLVSDINSNPNDIYTTSNISELVGNQIMYKDAEDRVSVAFLYGDADKFKVSNSLFDTSLKVSLEKTLGFLKRYYTGPNINSVLILIHKYRDNTTSSNYILDSQQEFDKIYNQYKCIRIVKVNFDEFIKYYKKRF